MSSRGCRHATGFSLVSVVQGVVFDALRKLMQPAHPEPRKRRIGFVTGDDMPGQTGTASDFVARDRPRPSPASGKP